MFAMARVILYPFQTRNEPRRQILRRQTAAGGRDVALRRKRLVEHRHARLFDPRFGGQVGAGRNAIQQAQLREYQRARALRAQKLTRRVEPQLRHQRGIRGNRACLYSAADQDRVGLAGVL
ncbi:hypothetical protein KCU90_g1182, partial [Aureobasidium melanogenum]